LATAKLNMIFQNARLIFPDGIRDGLEVVVENGKIAVIAEHGHARAKEADGSPPGSPLSRGARPRRSAPAGFVLDLHGNYLAPGFIDLHVHGAIGRDAMEASAEGFQAVCDYHASGGTTSLLLATATAPLDSIADVLRAIRECCCSIKQIAGIHVEGPFISKAKCGAQRAEFIENPSRASVQQLLDYADVIKRITIAPELRGASEAIENFHTHGINVSGGHSNAWDEEAREGFARGMRSVTHTFNCMSSARRRGIYRVGGLLELALSEPRISCELIADGHHVSETLMKMLYRAKGPRGICLVTDATAGAGLPDKSQFSLFGRDCVVEDGVCLLADHSALAGSASRMIDLVRTMVMKVNVPLHEAVMMATENPARAVRFEAKGCLKVDADADLVVLSPELEVLRTFSGGQEVFSH
jgi:N-acetylglucosamine-6-phosphate deacetylase